MSDDVIGGSTKTIQHSIKNISGNIRAVVLNLAPEMYITKKQKDIRHAIAMTTVMLLVLF